MPCIALVRQEFTVKFADGEVRISAEVVTDPAQFLIGMGIRMSGKRSVGLIPERLFGTVILLVPTKKRGFGDMVTPTDKGNANTGAVKFNGMVSGDKFMWQISL